jgi:hypothetical protein
VPRRPKLYHKGRFCANTPLAPPSFWAFREGGVRNRGT